MGDSSMSPVALTRNQLATVPTAIVVRVSRDELVLADDYQTTAVRGEREIREHLTRLASRHPAGAILYAADQKDARALRKLYPREDQGARFAKSKRQGIPQVLSCSLWPTVYFWRALARAEDRQAAWRTFEDH